MGDGLCSPVGWFERDLAEAFCPSVAGDVPGTMVGSFQMDFVEDTVEGF